MTVLTKPRLVLAFLMMSAASGCVTSPSGTAVDRLQKPAADHARALAGDDVQAMRKSGFVVLSLLEAYAGW